MKKQLNHNHKILMMVSNMKKLILFLATLLTLSGCDAIKYFTTNNSTKQYIPVETTCYTFTTTLTTSIFPNDISGYPQVITSDINICDMTRSDAEKYIQESYQDLEQVDAGEGHTITVTIVTTYK